MKLPSPVNYFEIQIQTATPQKLRLLLVEGAIRFARQAQEAWHAEPADPRAEALDRCRGILSELLSGVRPDGSDLTKQVTELYVFLLQRLTEAEVRKDLARLADVISVLEVERETWQRVCEGMPEAPAEPEGLRPAEVSAAGMTAVLSPAIPRRHGRAAPGLPARSQFSVEG